MLKSPRTIVIRHLRINPLGAAQYAGIHVFFDRLCVYRDVATEVYWPVIRNQDVILKTDAQPFFTHVNCRLAGEDHTCLYGIVAVGEVMHIQPKVVGGAVHEELFVSRGFFVLIFDIRFVK